LLRLRWHLGILNGALRVLGSVGPRLGERERILNPHSLLIPTLSKILPCLRRRWSVAMSLIDLRRVIPNVLRVSVLHVKIK